MLFSVVVPIYNVETYLKETIESVLMQSYPKFELILVNDGSTDSSGEICDRYSSVDRRIVVLHKENGGVSSARNAGIEIAKGEYLFLVDGDDLMNTGTMESIFKTLSYKAFKPDVIFANHYSFRGTPEERIKHLSEYNAGYIENLNNDQLCVHLFSELQDFRFSVWSHVYRTEFVRSNDIYFDTNLVIAEDIDWQIKIIISISECTATNKCIYLYRKDNLESAMNRPVTLRKYESSHYHRTKWFPFFLNEYDGVLSKPIMLNHIAKGYVDSAIQIFRIENPEDRKTAIELFGSQSQMVKYIIHWRYRALFPIKWVFGNEAFLRMVALAQKINRAVKLKLVRRSIR